MRVLVTGGTGVLGRFAVARLLARGHEVRVLSRRRSPRLPEAAKAFRGDLVKDEGLPPALRGIDAVLHAASNTGIGLGRGDLEGTANLLVAGRGARVSRVLYVSIVGIDRIPFLYYRRKRECERLLEKGGLPFTILRATQFHELLDAALRRIERLPFFPLPLAFRFQTVAADEVAARTVDLLEDPTEGRAKDFGGPEVLTLREMLATWRDVRGRGPRALPLPLPGRVARGFRQGWNTCPGSSSGRATWRSHVAGLPP